MKSDRQSNGSIVILATPRFNRRERKEYDEETQEPAEKDPTEAPEEDEEAKQYNIEIDENNEFGFTGLPSDLQQ